jgi:predicted Zn-dependent protease with MMP-like domain
VKEGWSRWLELAEKEVARTIGRLPVRLRKEVGALPVTYEAQPSRGLIDEGITPDTMGLFVGPSFEEETSSGADVPSQIILFMEVIRDEVDGDESEFLREVRRTYLHELGHYLGLDEDGLEDRDLG